MKCIKLISQKMGHIPIVELSGLLLQPNQVLTVSENTAKQLKLHYGSLLSEIGDCEVERLDYGLYSISGQPKINTDKTIGQNKSMAGKTKTVKEK